MKQLYDALLRTIAATILAELVSIPFIKLAHSTLSTYFYDLLVYSIPVFIAMLGYNLITAKINKRVLKESNKSDFNSPNPKNDSL